MYVCICNAVNQSRIASAINDGHATADAVYGACGVTPKCRKCSEFIEDMIAERHQPGVPGPADRRYHSSIE